MTKQWRYMNSMTARATLLLLAFVSVGILVVAWLAYAELDAQTEQNADIRIDRASRAASVIAEHRLGHALQFTRNEHGRPVKITLRQDVLPHEIADAASFDALLKEIGQTNQGAANFFSWNAQTRVFDRFATTFRLPDGQPPPALPIAEGHPGYAPSIAGKPIKGHMPAMGRMRLACLVPVLSPAGLPVGIFSIDVGWVDDLVAARNQLREKLAWSVLGILVSFAAAGAVLLRVQLNPLKVMARFAHGLAEGRVDGPVPYQRRNDEIGWLAEGLGRVAELQDKLELLAYRDPVTDLGNRARFLADLDLAMKDGGTQSALLMLDLDHFKQVNDAYGHQAGDDMLRTIARRITAEVGMFGSAARIGGDEFAVLLPRADVARVEDLGRRLISAISQPVPLAQGEIQANASIGVALLPTDAATSDDAYRNADLALRRSKSEGRGRLTFFREEFNETAQRITDVARMLRQALDERQLTLHFQPQISGQSLDLYGLEALLRWNHPTAGWIPPAEFIPVAESNGLIVEIGYWVIDEACRVGRRWMDQGFAFPRISVNVSAVQLWQPDFLGKLSQSLELYDYPAAKLCIEVTESVFVNHSEERILGVLSKLRELGLKVSLDDFGSGYSSLGYLNRLPIDQLKVDREFVKDVDTDTRKQSILRGIVALGHGLDLDIIAEGAETAGEVAFLRRLGCEAIQGFHFCRPTPADTVPAEISRITTEKADAARPLAGAHDPLLRRFSKRG
ncbi:MAG: putative bifunctional diguanylate cyclase/phosphodiesterase [Beijerinckiaceae bacterium]